MRFTLFVNQIFVIIKKKILLCTNRISCVQQYPCVNIIPHGARETFCEAKLIYVFCGCVCVYLSRLFIFPKLYSIWLFIFTFLELPLGVFLHPVQSFNYFYQFVVFTLKHTEYSHCVVIKITMGGVMMWLLFTLTVTRICIKCT